MTEYLMHGLTLTKSQVKEIINAAKKHSSVEIRLSHSNLQGDHKLPLTKTQIAQINKANKLNKGMDLKLSATQLKHMEKTGGLLPLAALLPLIFGGLGAAGGVAGGVASAVSAANNAKAAAAAQAETERHNREVEAQLKRGGCVCLGKGLYLRLYGRGLFIGPQSSGSGVVSDFVGKAPLIGSFLKSLLQKVGLGINDYNKIMNGGCVCLGEGLYLRPYGGGLFIGAQGSGLFLGPPQPA